MLTFPSVDRATELWIKGENFSIESLLQDKDLAQHFMGGSIVIARLAPQVRQRND
jgi:phosphatidylserine decarboxylase